MTENHPKSKLKRRKPSEGEQTDRLYRGMRRQTAAVSGDVTAEPRRPELPAGLWGTRDQMSAVESLWAATLKSSLSQVENQMCFLVPDLPHPSAERVAALKSDDQWWSDLSEEVPPLPGPSPPPLRTSSSPVRLSSSEQELSLQIQPSLASPTIQTDSLQTRIEGPQPTLCRLEEEGAASSMSHRRISLQQRTRDEEEEEVRDGREEEVQKSVGGDEARLKSCPMCLLQFPAGFTQMDCDGHLAQCLSEVNIDVNW